MDKQMIEEKKEIAKELDKVSPNAKFTNGWIAEKLYNAGYRKIKDNEIVITKEEYESLKKGVHTVSYQAMITESDQQHWLNGYKVGYRDGVVAVGIQTKQALEKIKTELIGEEQNGKSD
jgi:hypothetical protein